MNPASMRHRVRSPQGQRAGTPVPSERQVQGPPTEATAPDFSPLYEKLGSQPDLPADTLLPGETNIAPNRRQDA